MPSVKVPLASELRIDCSERVEAMSQPRSFYKNPGEDVGGQILDVF